MAPSATRQLGAGDAWARLAEPGRTWPAPAWSPAAVVSIGTNSPALPIVAIGACRKTA
jgi:hypothetical protein